MNRAIEKNDCLSRTSTAADHAHNSARELSARRIWTLGLLTAITGIAAHFKMALDVALVGRSKPEEIAAFAFIFPVFLIFTSLSQAFYFGTSATFTRDNLIRDGFVEARITKRFLATHLLLGSVLAISFWLALPRFLALLQAGPIASLAVAYCRIWLWSVPLLLASSASFSILRALGLVRTASAITSAAVVISAAASILVIGREFLGHSLPAIEAAAYSTVLFSLISFGAALFVVMRRTRPNVCPKEKSGGEFRVFSRVAAGVYASNLVGILYLSAVTGIMARTGVDGLTTLGLVDRYEQLLLAVQMGFIAVVTPALKNRYSAHDEGDLDPTALKAARVMLSSSCAAAGLALLLHFAAPDVLYPSRMAPDTSSVLVLVAASCGFQGIFILSTVMLNLRGMARYALGWSAVRAFGFIVPLAFIGSLAGKPIYVFALITAGHVVVGLLSLALIGRLTRGSGLRSHG